MKRTLVILWFLGLVPFMLGNRACEKATPFEHPPVTRDTACSDCHDDGRTRDTKPEGHDVAWERNHGAWIRQHGLSPKGTCTVCHTQSSCTECHQQQPPRTHTQFWRMKGHGVTTALDRRQCFTCHQSMDFCTRCHAQSQPVDHRAGWGTPTNRHCLGCHFPLTSAGASKCATCHAGTPSHTTSTPAMPSNAIHVPGANCRSCHTPLRHPDNGMTCTTCHQ